MAVTSTARTAEWQPQGQSQVLLADAVAKTFAVASFKAPFKALCTVRDIEVPFVARAERVRQDSNGSKMCRVVQS